MKGFIFSVGLGAVSIATLGTFIALGEEYRVVNIYNWEGYFGATTLDDFTSLTGIETNYDSFDAAEVMETKLLAGRSQYDVVFPSADLLGRGISAGVYHRLDRDLLPSWDNIDKRYLSLLENVDPENQYAVPYMWGTSGIAFNRTKLLERMPDAPLQSWDLIFNPEIVSQFEDCGVFIMDGPGEVVSAALNYLGKEPNSEDQQDLAEAMSLLEQVRPYVRHFNNSQVIGDLANGEICLALTYSGDAYAASREAADAGLDIDLEYVVPTEGAEVWFDVVAIPVDAPHPEAAHAFLNFLLDPEAIAAVTNHVYYANTISSSNTHISEEILTDPQIYPSNEVLDGLYTLSPHTQKFLRHRTRAWTSFKYRD